MIMTKVVYKKLRNFWGFAYTDKNLIELSHKLLLPRYEKKHLEIMIHEKIHIEKPDLDENDVLKLGKNISDFLWKNGYRKINLKS